MGDFSLESLGQDDLDDVSSLDMPLGLEHHFLKLRLRHVGSEDLFVWTFRYVMSVGQWSVKRALRLCSRLTPAS